MNMLSTPRLKTLSTSLGLLLFTQILFSLSNSDVLTLHNAGIGADTIVLAINNAEDKDFDVSADALVELKEAEVDEAVIQAILMAMGLSPPVQPVEQPESPPVVEEPDTVEPPALAEPIVEVKKPIKTPPQPLYRPAPVYPPSLKEQGISGSVMAKFVVNSEGGVQEIDIIHSDHDLFSAAASEALAGWKFKPGTEDGQPVDSDVKLEIPFNIAEQLSPLNRPPKAMVNPKPNYPRALRDKGVTGYVKVQFVVTDSGDVQNITVISSDHELFTEEALKVLQRWQFVPALQDGQPISSRVQFSIPFKITD